ncbi:caspase family protein [Leptolyngbya sp. 'hensonii']|uniref:caspase family protein n=1 Tax=Leptolyngbya sp. 'hensonii' TaxID=1922337 RepID=UPI0015C5639D|nr:caspase family protein [Leptolyngbya sp. 'hensonii']
MNMIGQRELKSPLNGSRSEITGDGAIPKGIDRQSCFAILIGINQYQLFHPLHYALWDAQAMQTFLVNEVGFPPEQCLLLTDSSPSAWGRSTYPTRETICNWLERFCGQYLHAEATVWCFFSGLGASVQGRDYLLPIDANPGDIPSTGISVQSLFDSLQAAGAKTTLALLDMNRNRSIQMNGQTGAQTIEVARNSGISTFLSCRPEEFSCESTELRQGFFTAALLEGLRHHGCHTVAQLEQYLTRHLPKLTDDYWRPLQHPVCVNDRVLKTQQLILPQTSTAMTFKDNHSNGNGNGNGNGLTEDGYVVPLANGAGAVDRPSANPMIVATVAGLRQGLASQLGSQTVELADGQQIKAVASGLQPTLYNSLLNQLVGNPNYAAPEIEGDLSYPAAPSDSPYPGIPPAVLTQQVPEQEEKSPESEVIGQQRVNESSPSSTMASPNPGSSLQPSQDDAVIEMEDGVFRGRLLLWTTLIAAFLLLGTLLRNQTAFRGVPNRDAAVPAASANGRVGAALVTSGKNPILAKPMARNSPNPVQKTPLEAARASLPNQPGRFREAIERARQIRPNQPQYEQAQANIERWSWVILDLAEGRAAEGAYQTAIATARLVPSYQPAVFAQAQQSIARWQGQLGQEQAGQRQAGQRQSSRELLSVAEKQLQPGRASTYNQAIRLASRIQAGDPEYKRARKLMDTWSQEIFKIAKNRARRGSYQKAIEAAQLVPANTASYREARRAIQQWKRR